MPNDPLTGITASLEGMTRELSKGLSDATRAGAQVVKDELLRSAAAQGRARFRGVKLGVTLKTIPSRNPVTWGRAGRSSGAWAIAEEGTKAHDIPRKKKAFKVNKDFVGKRELRHPGTAGTRIWSTGLANAAPKVDRAIDNAVRAALDKGF